MDAAEIQRLRELGYLDVSEEAADPELSGVTLWDQERACSGYRLFSHRTLCRADLMGLDGTVVHSWSAPGGRHWANCELLEKGDLLVVGSDILEASRPGIDDRARYLARLSKDSHVLWQRRMKAHHDVEITPRRQILTLGMNYRWVPAVHETVPLRDDVLVLLGLDGKPLERRSLYDCLVRRPEVLPLQSYPMKDGTGFQRIDLIHANSAEWMHHEHLFERHPIYAAGNVLVCLRHQDSIAILEWESGDLLWAWGAGEVLGPHDAQVLEDGNILLFDNGLGRGWSRVIELDPLQREIVWDYRAEEPASFYTKSRGAAQRLPNGNTLISNSAHGQAFEVTPEGERVWEFYNPEIDEDRKRVTFSRMTRYSVEDVRRWQQP
jgi:hypothetical protein